MVEPLRPDDSRLDDALDAGAASLSRGESLDGVLRRHPEHADSMRGPLTALQRVLAVPTSHPSPASRAGAARAMFAALDEPKAARTSVFGAAWATLGARHLRFQAAAAGLAVVLFGGIGFASAAGDRSPVPVPGFLHILATSSDNTVELRGTIVAVQGEALTIRTSTSDQSVAYTGMTEIRIGGERGKAADLAAGQSATVRASETNGTLHATRIVIAAAATAEASPAGLDPSLGVPTPRPSDDHGQDDADIRTPGVSDDRGDDGAATPGSDDGAGSERRDSAPSTALPSGSDDDHEGVETPSPGGGTPAISTPETRSTEPTAAAEPTQKPEPTQQPEPTEKPEPTEVH